MTRELAVAIILWKRGEPIDIALHSKLAAQGYEIPTLQRRYCA
jgi:hypothetical protein